MGGGIDTGYRVIADVTSGRFGVPNQEPCQPSTPAPEGSTPDAEEGINEEMPRSMIRSSGLGRIWTTCSAILTVIRRTPAPESFVNDRGLK